jgi:dTDP-4-dehydrorhamnose reductase
MPERPRLLVTGGSGYLGQRLVRRAQGYWDVTTTYLSHQPSIPGCRWTKLDVRDAKGVLRLFEQVVPQFVVHTAEHRTGEQLE